MSDEAAVGRTVTLHLVDGTPDGIKTATDTDWIGEVLMAPRTLIAKALERPEAQRTGIYILTGEKHGKPVAYIGESRKIGQRIKTHDQKKDWWTEMILAVSPRFNTAHAQYLESRLIEIAKEVNQVKLENENQPSAVELSEPEEATVKSFLARLQTVLPVLCVDIFTKREDVVIPTEDVPTFELTTKSKDRDLFSTAKFIAGRFVVEKGSDAYPSWDNKKEQHSTYARLHAKLKAGGVLRKRKGGKNYTFARNYPFSSPSAAAAVVNGRSTAGTLQWKNTDTGETYGEWEAGQLGVPRAPGKKKRKASKAGRKQRAK